MAESSQNFNAGEDAFWDHVDDVLDENDIVMGRLRFLRPGQVGSVPAEPTLEPEPPEAA